MSLEIFVFADWEEFTKPALIGTLRSDAIKNNEHFSFAYDETWLHSEFAQQIDHELHLYAGNQHNQDQNNFRTFLDSCPDRWGRLLMKRREAVIARQQGRHPSSPYFQYKNIRTDIITSYIRTDILYRYIFAYISC